MKTEKSKLLSLALALAALAFNLSVIQPAKAGSFTITGSLAISRFYHTAILLPNGKVLVATGATGSAGAEVLITNSELYNPATGTWSATGAMNSPRASIDTTTVLLDNGMVLVAGGRNSTSVLSSAELYNPATGLWTATGATTVPRYVDTATLLPNGKVLVAGGYDFSSGALSSTELYDPVTGTWTATGPMSTTRHHHTATLLPNGKVLVAGGVSGSYPTGGTLLSTAELYDPATATWTPTGSLNAGRTSHTVTLLPNGKVLATAGNATGSYGSVNNLSSAELYDSATGQWTMTGALTTGARYAHTATLLPNGKVLVAGGWNGSAYSSAELYNPATGTWTATASLNTARETFTATLLPNGKVLVAGGFGSGGNGLSSAELYADPGSLQVTLGPSGAVSAGAQWQVDGGTFQNTGVIVTNLTAGNHTVAFSTVAGWVKPADQIVPVNGDATNTTAGTYTQIGALQVTINPVGATSAGAQWQVDGGAFQNSGAVVTNLLTGSHLVAFNTVSGWLTPTAQSVSIVANITNAATGNYLPNIGSLQVTISPVCAVTAGAQWQVDGGSFQNSGAILNNLAGGSHTVAFKTIPGWVTPGSQIVAVTANTTNTAAGNYSETSTPGVITWINSGGANGNWSTATNWDLGRVPTTSDVVLIPNTGGEVCLLDVDTTIAGLLIGGCTSSGSAGLNLNGRNLTVNGPLTVSSTAAFTISSGTLVGTSNTITTGILGWSGGSLAGSFTISTNSTLLITNAAIHALADTLITNNGTVAWFDGDIWGGGTSPGTVIYNRGLWDAHSDAGLYGAYGGNSIVFNNAGTFRKSGGAGQTTFGFNGVFVNNTGSLDAQMGIIALTAGGNLTGGTATNLGGLVQLAGGNFNINGTITTTNVQMVGGSLVGTNVFANGFYWSGGDWNNGPVVTVAPNALLVLNNAGVNQIKNTLLTNHGTVAWLRGDIYGGGTLGTVIYNNGLWDARSDVGLYGAYGGNSIVFNNAGTFRKSAGPGQTTFAYNDAFLNNPGLLDAQSGTIVLTAGGNFNGGRLNFGLNSSSNYGKISFAGSMTLAGTLSANLNDGFIPAVGNSFSVLTYGSETGGFTGTSLPPGFIWNTAVGSTVYTIAVVSVVPAGGVTNLVARLQSGEAVVQFIGASNASYTVLTSTNVSLPKTNWNILGQPSQQAGSLFQYTDIQTSAYPQRFYQIRSP